MQRGEGVRSDGVDRTRAGGEAPAGAPVNPAQPRAPQPGGRGGVSSRQHGAGSIESRPRSPEAQQAAERLANAYEQASPEVRGQVQPLIDALTGLFWAAGIPLQR